MAAPSYTTDLTNVTLAVSTTNWNATGGGASGLNTETDYYIQGTQCVSKNGFTAATKGMLFNTTSQAIGSFDAVFIWVKQSNRNLLDSETNGGGRVSVGNSTSARYEWYVDGNDVPGSDLLNWVSYAVNPSNTASATVGSPTGTWTDFGYVWKVLGSGSLKGAPNGIDAIRWGREMYCEFGDVTNGYATFDGAATTDANSTNRWGFITPARGTYLFHGRFYMGTTSNAVDFRDSNRVITVLEDPHVQSSFNEINILNNSSNIEWDNIQITHLGTTAPTGLAFGGQTATISITNCRFDGCGDTVAGSNATLTDNTWINSDYVWTGPGGGATTYPDLSGSSILTPTVAADEGALWINNAVIISTTTTLSEFDDMTFSQGTNAHHAIHFGTGVTADITLTGIEFTGFSSSNDVNGSTLRFDATSGSLTVNLVDCTVDGNPATTSNVGVDDAAGIAVTLVVDPKTTKLTITDNQGTVLENARCFLETADNGGGLGFPYQAAASTLTSSGTTATLTASVAHGLATNDYVVVRDAGDEYFNKQAQITVTSTTAFTYTVDVLAGASAGGTPVYSYAAISGLTNASGIISSAKAWPASQGLTGWARKSSANVKQSEINITDASGGTDLQVALQPDI